MAGDLRPADADGEAVVDAATIGWLSLLLVLLIALITLLLWPQDKDNGPRGHCPVCGDPVNRHGYHDA